MEDTTHPETFTNGLSPKAVLAFLYPLIVALLGAVASWIITGNFSDSEIRTAASGVILSGLAALGAYIGHPGDVQSAATTPSDSLLPPDFFEKVKALQDAPVDATPTATKALQPPA